MPTFVNWLLRLLVTNPICVRLIQGGSQRTRHLYLRAGYLAIMITVVLFAMLSSGSAQMSVRDLASAGAQMFNLVSYLQVGLICLLTPVFMAGAIAQEANPKTWDILLTTPLNSLQVVLGNLFGRLFFIIALLISTLPLFAVTQFFGGVPGVAIFASYAIAGCSSLLVAAIAVTLSVTRTAGRRAVFWFYATVVMYLFVTYAIDIQIRVPLGGGLTAEHTTIITPLNPFLALKVLLDSNQYVPHDLTGTGAIWLTRLWLSQPIATFCWICVLGSLVLVAFSTARLRVISSKTGTIPWYRRLLTSASKRAEERPARTVAHNPIAWREAVARGKTPLAVIGRWGFALLGLAVALTMLGLYHTGHWTGLTFQRALAAVVAAEIVVVTLAALNMSATAVSREREDGTLDLILTTPIQPGPYLAGKLRGLIQFLTPMMLVPVMTLAIIAVYVLADGFGRSDSATVTSPLATGTGNITLPVLLWEGAIVLPLMFMPFVAFCVMIGLHWSIKSKGTISSVIGAVTVLIAGVGPLSLCVGALGNNVSFFGAAVITFSPINLIFAVVFPATAISDAISKDLSYARASLVFGAAVAAIFYAAAVYGMHNNMKRTFMMTVRRLAGTN